jgi:hypothetical protein
MMQAKAAILSLSFHNKKHEKNMTFVNFTTCRVGKDRNIYNIVSGFGEMMLLKELYKKEFVISIDCEPCLFLLKAKPLSKDGV